MPSNDFKIISHISWDSEQKPSKFHSNWSTIWIICGADVTFGVEKSNRALTVHCTCTYSKRFDAGATANPIHCDSCWANVTLNSQNCPFGIECQLLCRLNENVAHLIITLSEICNRIQWFHVNFAFYSSRSKLNTLLCTLLWNRENCSPKVTPLKREICRRCC